jgi:hypothetical protein
MVECSACADSRRPGFVPSSEPSAACVPGLGEIMTLNQMRHAKHWLAAQAGNWPLAAYEVDELEEGLQVAIEFHPTHKTSPVSIAEVITPPRKRD